MEIFQIIVAGTDIIHQTFRYFYILTRVEPYGEHLGVVLEENRGVRVVKISKTRCDILAPDVWYELITSRIHPILNL